MRFRMLLKKELRESLPWILSAAILMLAIGVLSLRLQSTYMNMWRYDSLKPNTVVDYYVLRNPSALQSPGLWLICLSLGLGLVLAGRQFGLPFITRTWPFLLHRPASRMTILAAKLTVGLVAQIGCLGTIWLILYHYASGPEMFVAPPSWQSFTNGWLCILFGLIAYLGTALTALSESRWYTTKPLGFILAALVVFATLFELNRPTVLTLFVLTIVILLSQIVHTFQRRDF